MDVPSIDGKTGLVTGGDGFIGSHIIDALVADNAVRILDDFSTGTREYCPEDTFVLECHIRDDDLVTEAMACIDLVFREVTLVSKEGSIELLVASNAVKDEARLQSLRR